jgi:carbonic anhydrase
VPKFGAGVVKFEREIYPENEGLFALLSEGQSPEAMFITCSDSRIELGMLTQSKPGELFVVRNAGNIVPPHDNRTGATTAAIEFAVGALKVPHIVICGHTDCGAVKGALAPEKLDALPHVRDWLGYMRAAVQIVDATGQDMDEKTRMMYLLQQNVLLQLAHLRTHPSVAVALAKKEVQLHGWVYNIGTGQVLALNDTTGEFEDVEQRYAVQVTKHFESFHQHD